MKYEILSSSSKGNAIIIEDILLLDCGVSYAKLKPYINKIKLIYISHIHKDHLLPSTIKKIAYYKPNIKFITSSKEAISELYKCGVSKKNMFILKPATWYNLGLIKVATEMLYHDVSNYALRWEYKGKLGFYAVDTSKIEHIEAKNYDLYLIENNYQEKLLKKHIEECSDEGELFYLKRVEYTHLSSEQANSFLIENMGNNSKFGYIHQSSYNFEKEEE